MLLGMLTAQGREWKIGVMKDRQPEKFMLGCIWADQLARHPTSCSKTFLTSMIDHHFRRRYQKFSATPKYMVYN